MRDRERLEALFADHAAAVRAYALRRADAATADDIVSEVFVVACRRLDAVPSDSAVKIPPACSQRTPSFPNTDLKSIIPGLRFDAAECPSVS